MSRPAFLVVFFFAALSCAHSQWQLEESHTAADLRGIHALGNGIAWASGTEGTVLRTTDDGANWQRCAIPPDAEALDFRGIQAFDANTAVVMSSGKGGLSRVYKTTDACATWALVFTNPDVEGSFQAMSFSGTVDHPEFIGGPWLGHLEHHIDVERHELRVSGYLLGAPLNGAFRKFHSYDRGTTWQIDPDKPVKFVAKEGEVAFAAGNQSLLTDPIGRILFVTGGDVARLRYRADDCQLDGLLCFHSALVANLPLAHGNETSGAYAMTILPDYRIDPKFTFPYKVVIVGGDEKHPEATNGLAARVDLTGLRGFAVRAAKTPPHGFRSAVSYDTATKTWITVGPNGTDISRDDGRNWSTLKPSATDAPDADRYWNALSLPFVVGPHGRIGKLRAKSLAVPAK